MAAQCATSCSAMAQSLSAGSGPVYAGGTGGPPPPLPHSVLPHCGMTNLNCGLLNWAIDINGGCCDDPHAIVDSMSNGCMV